MLYDPRNVIRDTKIKEIEEINKVEDVEKKLPFGRKILIFWMPSWRSRCNGTCLDLT